MVCCWRATLDASFEAVVASSQIDRHVWTREGIKLMSDDHAEIDQLPTPDETAALKSYRRRIWLIGFAVLMLSMLVGVGFSFYQWDRGSPFDLSTWEDAFVNPVARATYGPLIFVLFIFPFVLVLLVILAVPVYFGLKKQSRWPLALLPFLTLGVLWVLWIRALWVMD